MVPRPRELEGRSVFQALQKFEWRYSTLKTDRDRVVEIREPDPGDTVSTHRYTVRSELHEAERRLHHYLSGYYSFKSLVTTLAEESPNPEFEGRVKDRRDEFAQKETTRVLLGLRHYVQHHNILPLLIKISSFTQDGPWYVINKDELRLNSFEYREPQMIRDVENHEDWFDYYYEAVDRVCIFPIYQIEQNWEFVDSLREDIYELAREHLQDEITEYVEELSTLVETRESLRDEHEELDVLLDSIEGINPELEKLLNEDLYSRVVKD